MIQKLHVWGSPEIVEISKKLYHSYHWHKRLLAIDIFNQLLVKDKLGKYIHYEEEASQAILLSALDDEQLVVVRSAICGLGHRPIPLATSRLVSYANHEDVGIRYDVAITLGSYSEDISIKALLDLARDEDDDVRNWATFGLGTLHETIDTPAIRELLWHNVSDENDDVSGEALVGLAIRKDPRVIEVLKLKLNPDCMGYLFRASEYIADRSLYPFLKKIDEYIENEWSERERLSSFWVKLLHLAMGACKPN